MEALTYSTVAVTLGLVVTRPRLTPRIRLTPATAALAGVGVLTALGSVRFADIGWAAETMWRPLLGIVSIMMMTGVARRMGVLDSVAEIIFRRASKTGASLFAAVFAFGTLTAAVLNNDSAILLLTPLIVDIARRKRPDLVVPLAFAVFLSAGVAPLVVSNPMNMVVASYAGIGFNEYAKAMAIPALAGCLATFGTAFLLFRRDLAASQPPAPSLSPIAPIRGLRLVTLLALGAVVGAYPVVSYFDGPVWIVAFVGALVLLAIGRIAGERPKEIIKDGVHLDTLLFLIAALILSIGLRNAGIVERIARLYEGASPMRIGLVSAAGSALLNNHPMSNLNVFALKGHVTADVLASLVGGDLGPRFFPIGSLAGLLWLEMLRRSDVVLPMKKFLVIGAVATLPALLASLFFLAR
jgi:arsenical pump membrane protein